MLAQDGRVCQAQFNKGKRQIISTSCFRFLSKTLRVVVGGRQIRTYLAKREPINKGLLLKLRRHMGHGCTFGHLDGPQLQKHGKTSINILMLTGTCMYPRPSGIVTRQIQ